VSGLRRPRRSSGESIWHGEEPVDLIKKVAWWRCTNTGHPLARVGQLTAQTARTL
jgi:hypothetical protein